jgi:hypothetical protein
MAEGVEGDTAGGEDGGSTAMVSLGGLGAALGLLGGGVFEESVVCLRELAGEALLAAAGLVADDLVPFTMASFVCFVVAVVTLPMKMTAVEGVLVPA